jgi:hypothetical protein
MRPGFKQLSHKIWNSYVLSRTRTLFLEADRLFRQVLLEPHEVLAQQGYVEFSRGKIFRTPLLTLNFCSLSDGNIASSVRFPLCVGSWSGYGLGKYSLRDCK